MKRNILIIAGLCAALAAFSAPASMIPIAGDPVGTSGGKVAGTLLASGVKAYLGIPYAKPPVQDLRWAAPRPMHWSGIWNADRTGPECVQILRPHGINHYFGEEPTGEDCLYLNIWVPADAQPGAKRPARRPVIVFIYGGGGTVGSSGMAVYGGENVARHGAIYVNFNYRVGIFGYMAHPGLSREQGGHSGNYGYLDQNAALQWVHDNIAAFGGDPAKVAIAGQSFGAASVAAQLFSPLSKGLFRGAAMWSACSFSSDVLFTAQVPLAVAEHTGEDIQKRLGAADLAEMRQAPADRILALQEEHQLGANVSGLRLPPVVDGLFWTADKAAMLAAHQMNDVPIIAGSNGDDLDSSRNPLTSAATVAEFDDIARRMYGADADEFLRLFPVAGDAQVRAVAREAAAEDGLLRNSRTCAMLQTGRNTSAAYVELFTRKHPYQPGVKIADQDTATVGAYHTADVPYWLGTFDAFNGLRTTRVWTEWDRQLSDTMMQALISLAATGDPGADGRNWPRWTAANPQMIVFGDAIRVQPMPVQRMDWLAAHPPAALAPATPAKARTTRD
jgi:para-nitrobenzyl esterase